MSKKSMWIAASLILLLALLIGDLGCKVPAPIPKPTPTPAQSKPLPEFISLATMAVGTMVYTTNLQAGEVIRDITGLKIKLMAGVEAQDALQAMRSRLMDAANVSSAALWEISEGSGAWATPQWGPQPLRLLWLSPTTLSLLARGNDTSIKSPYDLKGKKLPRYPGNPARTMYMMAAAAFGGVGEANATWVPAVELAEAAGFLKEGRIDAFVGNHDSSYSVELQTTPSGVKVIDLDPNDKAGWNNARKVAPFLQPSEASGSIIPKGESRTSLGIPTTWSSYEWFDDAAAYAIAKGLVEGYNRLAGQGMHATLKRWTLETALNVSEGFYPPYHPGAVRYFKEIGKWTPELEAWQKRMIEDQAQRIGAWQKKYGAK